MNKKFLSAILFGALMVASTGTFVSCKDYDDDIDSLNEKVDQLAKDLSDLQTAAGKYVTAVSYDAATGKLTVTGGNGGTFQLAMPVELPTYSIKVVDGKVQLLEGDDVISEATLPTVNTPEAFDPSALKWENGYLYYGDVKIDGVQQPSVKGSISLLKDEKTGEVVGYLIEEGGESATFSLVADLKALVFQPAFYYQGIEAMEAIGITYNALGLKKVDADGDYETDAPTVGDETTMVPDLVADYHVNPTVAKVPGDVKAYTFLRFDKAYKRSATSAPTIVKTNVENEKAPNGVLTVNAHFTDADIKDIQNDGEVTVLALQVETEDAVVTSDYAAVKANNYKDLVLAAADAVHPIATADRHLFTNAADAINDNDHVQEIVWNHEGLDIAKLINTHRTTLEGVHSKWDENAASGTVEKYGFKYSYELVGYHKGDNETSESAHAALKGSLIRPQMTSGGKQQAWGFDQNKATKDREPLVRITLTDEISGKVAAVGYLKFKITEEAPVNKNEVVLAPNFPFADGYTVDCSEKEIKLALTWHQVEEQILAQLEDLGISKDEFHTNFKLDGGETDATQYDGILVDSKAVVSKIGTVEQTTWDSSDEMTEVLIWTVKNNQAYHAFKNGAKSIAVNVRYSYDVKGDASVFQYVYVTFTWTPSPLNVTPNGNIADAAKIDKYWYAKNNAVAGSGYSDIHANVQQVISNSAADCTFDSEILNTFTGNKITVTSDATYPAFADANLTKTVVFANPQDHLKKENNLYVVNGASGAKYSITVSADGKTLNATKDAVTKAVVVLNDNSGTVMKYQDNDFAKDILNYADHNELADGETFTAKLQINAANCDYVAYKLNNNVFYAKYLRPVSVDPSDVDELVDATNGASIAGLTLNLVDWRDKYFDKASDTTGDDGTVYNFYGFYGVTKITADIKNATTNLNNGTLGTTKLEDVTKNVKLYYGADKSTTNEFTSAKVGDNGKFYYYNNGTTLGKFTIRVPMVVTYKWGTIYTSVDLNINKTIQN